MRNVIYLIVVLLLFTAAKCKQPVATSEAVSIIFDTDMGGDFDDVGALTMLHALADSGEAKILATLSSNQYELTVPCIDVINTYCNHPDIPVGKPLVGVNFSDSWHKEPWPDTLVARFPHDLKTTEEAPDAVNIYRKILAAEADTSVVIVTVGFLSNLAALLESVPDEYSPLDGRQLVNKKVKRLVAMAGHFPAGREYNLLCDSTASRKVIAAWPTRIIFSGFEIGNKILTGKRLIASNIAETPAKITFAQCLRQADFDGRMSWDETAVLVAVRGLGDYFGNVRGHIIVASDGSNTWRNDPHGKHEYLTFKMPVEKLTHVIEDLMMHE